MKITNLKLTAFSLLFLTAACNKDAAKQTSVQSAANANEAALATNLVAWYTFDGDVLDHSGNGNDVAFNNATPAAGKDGVANTAYKFDGSSSFMTVPNSNSLQGVPGKGITIAVKFKVEGFYNGPCHGNRILQKGEDTENGVYMLGFDDRIYWNDAQCSQPLAPNFENFYGAVGDNQFGGTSARTTDYVSKDEWYVVVYSYNPKSNYNKLYINNNEPNTVFYDEGPSYHANSSDLYIGRMENPQFPYWFNGVIDEIRIYNKTLSDDEAQLVSKNLGAQ